MCCRTQRGALCLAGLVALVALVTACTDLRDFRGTWQGTQVGAAPELHVGVAAGAGAGLTIDDLDKHGLSGHLTVEQLIAAPLASVPGAEADALASMTWDGAPLRVYLAFVPTIDGGGDALAVIALYDQRIELRLMRGGTAPLYAIFDLRGAS